MVVLYGRQLELEDAYNMYEELNIKTEMTDNKCLVLSKEED